MTWRLTSMTAGLAVGITAAVGLACAIGAWLYSRHHFDTLLASARDAAVAQGSLIRDALEHEMIENDRTLIARMVEGFGRQPRVATVMLLDRQGVARFSGGPASSSVDLSLDSPTCQACHRLPPAERGLSRVIEVQGGTVLRTVMPFRNREACHRCHDPSQPINGILLMDLDVGELRASMHRDLRWMVGGSAVIALALVSFVAMIIRVVVLRRLQRFETTARLIADGDLERRVPVDGSDTISWLAREFNTMADSMTGLVTEVRHQHERLETVINSIDDGIVVLDRSRRILAANAAFLKRTGLQRDEVMSCTCHEVTASLCTMDDCPTLACLRGGQPQVRISERRAADGSTVSEEIHASAIGGPDGQPELVVEVWRDISERRVAEARLADAHRLASLGVLASGFSHELNTPLATVLACLEGVLRDARAADSQGPGPSRVAEIATVARDQILRCRSITQHFLRLSRGQPSPGEAVDVDAAVSAVARLVTPTARAAGVTIVLEGMPTGLRVLADDAELQHALINLVLNAVQASKSGTSVAVAVRGEEQVRIRVSDQGGGIAPEHQAQIFEPFFSLRKGGTGLGLFLAITFIRRWGGDIRVESAPGRGATFEIVLPALSDGPADSVIGIPREIDGHTAAR
ncbi:MAG TPA: ATP-binding protein [Vicinamibacterales bacterium]|nr:ATP-binding protein [Vicinamibacterales bacterium]